MEKGAMLKPGSVFVLPANHTHQIWTTDEEAIIQVQLTGPGNISYINPLTTREKEQNNQTRQIHNCAARAMFGRSEG